MVPADTTDALVHRLIGGDAAARDQIVGRSRTSNDPVLLVAAALVSGQPSGPLLERAGAAATTTRDRQLVAIAAACVESDHDRLDALVRDHLADHPGNVLVAWIAATRPTDPGLGIPQPVNPKEPAMPTPTVKSPTVKSPIGSPRRGPSQTGRSRRRLAEPSTARTAGRWLLTFAGFPLGGLAAKVIVGPIDGSSSALVGGLITGSILGAVQAWGLRRSGSDALRWAGATGIGFGVGLAAGSGAVGHATTVGALATQGAVTGLAVGLAQAVVLRRSLGPLAAAWPIALAAVWALGWTITTSIGVQVDERFTVFGSSGAVVVAALTSVLPLVIARREASAR